MFQQIRANKQKSFFLMFFFVLIVAGMGYLVAYLYNDYFWFVFFLIIALLINFFAYQYSDSIILKMSRAKPVEKKDNPYLYNVIEGLALAAGIPAPKAYIIDDTAPNAFATGRDPKRAVICVTTGLLQKLDRLELEGVVAHEMSHIKNFDIRYMTMVAVLVGTIVLLSDWLRRSFVWGGGRRTRKVSTRGPAALVFVALAILAVVIAPLLANLIKFAISRQREFLADASGAMLTRYPEGLASALDKITKDTEPLEVANKATEHLYIVNPLMEHRSLINNLFSTHPPAEERIRRLRSM
jgi:heat shock protein HtpX